MNEQEKSIYLSAQKKRNQAIGLALFAFVALVFVVSMVRITQNVADGRKAGIVPNPEAGAQISTSQDSTPKDSASQSKAKL